MENIWQMLLFKATCIAFNGIVHFEINLICFSLPQGHPRCRCLCFHSIFNFDIFRTNRCCLSVI